VSIPILFHSEIPSFKLKKPVLIRSWINSVISANKKNTGNLSFIFCTDTYLLDINNRFLQHDYYTDVITFDYSEKKVISGDIYLSIDRIKDNAQTQHQPFETELHRVMVHGVLHLLGHSDKGKSNQLRMRKLEDKFLSLLA
jgi:probable rRNA maturation factor